jgi:DNA-binding NarL/FixJ family response regulator
MQQAMKSIFLVDDHPMLRRGLATLIESEPDLKVCGEASTVQEALRAMAQAAPDLTIVDLGLRGPDGLHLIRAMKQSHPAIPALVLSMYDESEHAERAFRAGARGYLSKTQMEDTVLTAIRCVLDGGLYMSAALGMRFAEKFLVSPAPSTGSPLAVLSDRELEIFRLIGEGQITRQIAQRLHLSIKTIESHREHIKHKLTLESGSALLRYATRYVETGRTG